MAFWDIKKVMPKLLKEKRKYTSYSHYWIYVVRFILGALSVILYRVLISEKVT